MPEDRVYQAEYAGHSIRYSFRCPETHLYFGGYAAPVEGDGFDIREDDDFFAYAASLMPDLDDHYVEFRSLACLTARELLKHGCCIFHAASFIFRGRAWLLSAPSGTGKSTQFMNWQRRFPGETRMISGDMPVIETRGDGIFVHSSPWNGKEMLGRPGVSAPLGGIVLLERGEENRIERPAVSECIFPLLRQFVVRLTTEDEVRALCEVTDRILRAAPVLRFVNRGDHDSTALLREELIRLSAEEEAQ